METNYVLLMGLFLLLVAVDCSSSNPIPKGNVKENSGLDQNVDGTVDPVKINDASKSISDSVGVNGVEGNGGDLINGSGGGIESDTSKSNVNQQSGSNEGEDLQKDEKVRTGAKENTDGEKGDNDHKGQEELNLQAKGKTDGETEGDTLHKGQEESKIEGEGKTAGEKGGDVAHKSEDEPNDETKGNTDGEKGDAVHKGQEESTGEAEGKRDGGTSGDTVHSGQEESIDEVKGKTGGEKDGDTMPKGQEESDIKAIIKTDGQKKENSADGVDLMKTIKDKGNAEESIPPPPTRNDGFRGEDCDPSNMCMDRNKRFAACLRVPGNESPDLSLLIQNKGEGPLTIKISAPAFVQLEETDVELQEKQDKKVKVSIKSSGTKNLIVLKDGSGECILDFKDLMMHNSAKTYVNFLSQTPTTTFIFVAAVLILASGWICMNSRRKQLIRSGLKYRRMDMELPVTGGAKPEPNVNDGWDNSWGDNWDDEEAPMTPSKPVTPSLSSKGLASRRLSKEGWKD